MSSRRKRSRIDHDDQTSTDTRGGGKSSSDADAEIEKISIFKKEHEDFSEYERVRLENIKRNEEFLSNLGIQDILRESRSDNKTAASKRGFVPSSSIRRNVQPTRRSGRVTIDRLKAEIKEAAVNGMETVALQEQLINMQTAKDAATYHATFSTEADESVERIVDEMIPFLPLNMPPDVDASLWRQSVLESLSSVKVEAAGKSGRQKAGSSKPSKMEAMDVEGSIGYSRLTVKSEDVAKLTQARVTSTWLHPSTSKLICAAGDTQGYLGLWDVDNLDPMSQGVLRFKPHTLNVCSLHTWASDPCKLHTVSYDGTIRILDLEKEAFTLGFQAPESVYDVEFRPSIFRDDGHSVLIGRSDGKAAMVDLRAGNSGYEWCHSLQNAKINSLQSIPTDQNLIVSAGSGKDGCICIHDIRRISKSSFQPVVSFSPHSKSINAAVVSPNGQVMVSVSQDNTIKAISNFCSPSFDQSSDIKTVRHDNHTGRWLSTFHPTFDPKRPHNFIVGSMEQPRKIDIFTTFCKSDAASSGGAAGSSGSFQLSLLMPLRAEPLASVCSRNCFHPTEDVIACGNSSGRVHIFR